MGTPAPARLSDLAAAKSGHHGDSSMLNACLGNEITVRGTAVRVAARDGELVGLHRPEGSPPYDVRWADGGRFTLYFPGPDAYVRHLTRASSSMGPEADAQLTPAAPETGGHHVRTQ
ncbi:DUF1918 domain-containing protein [Streptomyces sp. NPDC015139]|uniref:DUF1918 domain-containing protein n=1 Tax=Streptomyces sp. NPDC015139 TaxID=3364942 RepID=UPI0036F88F93